MQTTKEVSFTPVLAQIQSLPPHQRQTFGGYLLLGVLPPKVTLYTSCVGLFVVCTCVLFWFYKYSYFMLAPTSTGAGLQCSLWCYSGSCKIHGQGDRDPRRQVQPALLSLVLLRGRGSLNFTSINERQVCHDQHNG